ncbi:MAG: xanthine dehydrogenase molybdopterin binding subunit, partial [Caulobacterales bacterium]|nr:xanthine dehydrogenase molybdopterin binding subunit [Caulobacterales bacterium]
MDDTLQPLANQAPERIRGDVGEPRPHDSAHKHVAGAAAYVDDIPEPVGLLHVYIAMSTRAHARLAELDLSAVRAAPGVAAVLAAGDVPGVNDHSPIAGDDPIFAEDEVNYVGQSLFAVAADSLAAARAAAAKARVVYEDLPAAVTIEQARAAGLTIEPAQTMRRGDAEKAIAKAAHRVTGGFAVGGQDHFYLEGQVALAIPGEDGDMHVYSSTQNPTEIQHVVAHALGEMSASVVVEVRRMGGAFGGKETQPALMAAVAAMVAAKTGRPAKLRLDRDDDMVLTGKRHDFVVGYEMGVGADGRIEGARITLESRCGCSADLSVAVNDRAMFHADNCYYVPNVEIVSHRYRTHTVSNTAFRGFGGPQGMIAIERVMDHVAHQLGLDPLTVRARNLYEAGGRDVTPYFQTVEDLVALDVVDELAQTADYAARREAIDRYNAASPVLQKGLALTPVKFGISFTARHLNQAGALIHVYTDGSVHLAHGGTEMGQGLMVKVAQVVAHEFQIDIEKVKVTATRTDQVPNTSPTAASSGSDLNGMAAREACRAIIARLRVFAADTYDVAPEDVVFENNHVLMGSRAISFQEFVNKAYFARVSLSATGFYRTPKIHYDRAAGRGRPFFYFAYGAALSEVTIDTLTGESRIDRVDIRHDVGKSLNPAVDLGQIEGGFIQGAGWLTSEELVYSGDGRLLTHAPSTYKIP